GFAWTAIAASTAAARLAFFLADGFTQRLDRLHSLRCSFGFRTRFGLARRARRLGGFAATGFGATLARARCGLARFTGLTRFIRACFAAAFTAAFTAAATLAGLAVTALARPFAAREGGSRFGCRCGFGRRRFF